MVVGDLVKVVAWYLPGFVKPAVDARRARAMLTFRTPKGAAFDGVALDIENGMDPAKAAQKWIDANPDTVAAWLK